MAEMIDGEKVLTNPTSGAKVVLRGGAWTPYTPKAAPPAAAPQQGLGEKIGNFYKNDIAAPATQFVGQGINDMVHPMEALQRAESGNAVTPIHQLPKYAQDIAKFVVPQTGTEAAITAGAFMLPEAKIAQKLGEAAGPVSRVLGTRMGRIGALTGIGALSGAATGEGKGSGAMQGAAAAIPGEALAGAAGMVGRRIGETPLIRDTTKQFGAAIKRVIPWVGDLEKGSDFANAFIHGGATEKAGNLLNSVKTTLGRRVQGHVFGVPIPTVQGVQMQYLPFHEADKLISEMQDRGYGIAGDPRGGMDSPNWRKLAFEVRDRIAAQLNGVQKGLGDAYLKARKQFDIAKSLGKIFKKDGLFVEGGLSQPELLKRMNQYAPDLDRSMGKAGAKSLSDTLKRGFIGEGADVPSKAGSAGLHLSPMHPMMPIPHMKPGHSYKAIGDAGIMMNPPAGPIEAGINQAIGMATTPTEKTGKGPGVKHLEAASDESLAPTPSATKRAGAVREDLGKGKNPDVHNDLMRGRLSMDEVNKLVQQKPDAMAMLTHVPLTEAVDALEVTRPDERKMLTPLVEQKMRQELQGGKYNRTMMASLAQRLQRLKAEA